MNGGGGYEDVRGQVATFLLNQDNTNTQQMIGQLQPASGLQQLIEVSHFLHKQTIHPQHIHFIAEATITWNNGMEVPRWGVAEIQVMSPSTTGRCYCCH